MAISYKYKRVVIQQGMSFGMVFPFRNPDLVTCEDFSDWSATFEVFNADGNSLFKFSSEVSPNVRTGLWNPTGDFAYNVYVEITKEFTATLNDWGVGHFDLDVIDPFGHAQYRVHDVIILEEGTKHV